MRKYNKKQKSAMRVWHFAALFALFFAKASKFEEFKRYSFDFLVSFSPMYKNILEFLSTFIVYFLAFYVIYFLLYILVSSIKKMFSNLKQKREVKQFENNLKTVERHSLIYIFYFLIKKEIVAALKFYIKGWCLLVNVRKYKDCNNLNYDFESFLVLNFLMFFVCLPLSFINF